MSGTMICGDALEEMRKMESKTFGAIVTSPPYNLRRSMDDTITCKPSGQKWKGLDLGYAKCDDSMPYDNYVRWQRECLSRDAPPHTRRRRGVV